MITVRGERRRSVALDMLDEVVQVLAWLPPGEHVCVARDVTGTEEVASEWPCVGRDRPLTTIDRWLDHPPDDPDHGAVLVVTGPPGAGKSTVLTDVLIRDDHALRDALVASGVLREQATTATAPRRIDLSLRLMR
jgi:hypothetical protein